MTTLKAFFNNLRAKHFDFAVAKLSLFYVLIVMAISISFSVAIYKLSSNELDRGLVHQSRMFQNIPQNYMPIGFQNLEQIRLAQLEESNHRLQTQLIYFNLLILILSGTLSYFFARKTLEPIKEAMEAQNRFTADASHELRTPLTAMKTEIEVALRSKELTLSNSKKLLESNLEEIAKLESLSGALLKLAKAENTNLTFEPVDLEEAIIEAYERVEKMTKAKSIEFETNIGDSSRSRQRRDSNDKYSSIPPWRERSLQVHGDKQSLVELFVILLDNAVKYSPKDSKICINMAAEGDRAVIKIKDEGIGIKASDLPHIFDRFYRADHSRNKEKIAGYGLGLAIAKQIVDLHAGTITATSEHGKGSIFTVKL